ncbi:MAG: phospho-sugar mutase [Clostridia bacterium]|nr:phospho-sugar mutase [Clostridia bacterium]
MNGEYGRWLVSPFITEEARTELYNIKGNEAEIASRFACPMSFGTAGLRSVMGAGIARMNIWTVAQATRGLASLIKQANGCGRGVAVAYDCRNNARLFAHVAACVLAGEGIKVYLFDSLRPTPELSFAVLHHNCIAGINVTASHNTKEYNGYKVYWEDGAQLPPEHADKVAFEMARTDVLAPVDSDIAPFVQSGIIEMIGEETDEAYLKEVLACRIDPGIIKKYGNTLSLVYSPLHGAGYKLVPEALRRAGIDNFYSVPGQDIPDGDFPTVASPNPEYTACFEKALGFVKEKGLATDVIIATDPDGDRLGVAVKQKDGTFAALSGNKIGALLVDYIIKARRKTGTLPANAAAVRSAVSSELFDDICRKNGVSPVVVLTGFKYIGEKIKEYAASGEHTFIFGYEESQGFLSGGYVRDKDGVAASLLIAEAACYYKSVGKTLNDALEDIFAEYGFHDEKTVSVAISGNVPMEVMRSKMQSLRERDIDSLGGSRVTAYGDCLTQSERDKKTGEMRPTGLPKADMLYYRTENGSTVLIRPSGTEPKVKIYIFVKGKDKTHTDSLISAIKEEASALFA